MWIDSKHLLRRMGMTIPVPQAGSELARDVTMNFSHFGIPVSIAPPQASSVVSFEQFEASAWSAKNLKLEGDAIYAPSRSGAV